MAALKSKKEGDWLVLESNTLDFLFLNDGEKGVPGEKGDDGKTLYTWIKYSQYSDGSNMTDDPTDARYIGLSYNNESATESNNPSDYKWTKIKGNDGGLLQSFGGWM